MIDIIGSVYRVSRGETGRTGFFSEGAENLVVKILEVSVARWRTLGRGRGGSDCRHRGMGTGDWSGIDLTIFAVTFLRSNDERRRGQLMSIQTKRGEAQGSPFAFLAPAHDTVQPQTHIIRPHPQLKAPLRFKVPICENHVLASYPYIQVPHRERRCLVPERLGSCPTPSEPGRHHSSLACPPACSPCAR